MGKRVFFLCLIGLPALLASDSEPVDKTSGRHEAVAERKAAAELESTELVFSERVHSASLDLGVARGRAGIGALYYGSETYRVGAFGVAKNFRYKHILRISPGLNAAFIDSIGGHESEPATKEAVHAKNETEKYRVLEPAYSIRWKLELGEEGVGLVSEGAFLQTLLATNGRRNFYSDGSHASIKTGRVEFGAALALANHGLEEERKGGPRLAIKFKKGFGIAAMLLLHGKPEYRAGLFYSR